MRLIDADYVTEKLNEINGTAELDKAFEVVENAPTVDVLEQITAEIYEEFMTIDGGVHDESAKKCMQIIDKYRGITND